jgi:hypothetical protein
VGDFEEIKMESSLGPVIQNRNPLIEDAKEANADSNINNLYESRSQIGNPPADIEDVMRGNSRLKNEGSLFKKTTQNRQQ